MSIHSNQPSLYHPNPDETATPLMFYTYSSLIWGEIIHPKSILPSRILTGISVPDFIALNKAQILVVTPNSISKPQTHPEVYLPTRLILAYHLMPPLEDKLDYDPTEPNRIMTELIVQVGAFCFNAQTRISAQTSVRTNLEVSKAEYFTVYNPEITHLTSPNLKPIKTNMAYLRTQQNIFSIP